MTTEELAYAAGLFDGEGYVSGCLSPGGNHTGSYIYAGCGMCNKEAVTWLHESFPGGHLRPRKNRETHNEQPSWMWHIYGKYMGEFLSQIQPYSRMKKPHIEIALAWVATGKGKGKGAYTDQETLVRMRLINMVQALSIKG